MMSLLLKLDPGCSTWNVYGQDYEVDTKEDLTIQECRLACQLHEECKVAQMDFPAVASDRSTCHLKSQIGKEEAGVNALTIPIMCSK